MSALSHWLLEEESATNHTRDGIHEGPGVSEEQAHNHTHPWWQVGCLTGVDYFSTLGYQPGIAALAAGALSPFATLILVLLTLFGALPMYKKVAEKSPHGEGSIAMLERLLPQWNGKLFVLVLLGFVATDFIITITLSAADAAAHIVENPLTEHLAREHAVGITLTLVAILAAVFLKGFKEAIGIAVVLVIAFLALNATVIGVGLYHIAVEPGHWPAWKIALFTSHPNVMGMVLASLLLFPKLALGMSGFETGVVVMPLVKGDASDTKSNPVGRIKNTHKLLTTVAVIMSVYLILSSLVTTLLIPANEFRAADPGRAAVAYQKATDTQPEIQAQPAVAASPAGKANGRALAYMAHQYLGEGFGTIYDISTVCILWFAGASAMAGLLNVVPRYLPRYGMAPNWARATRPLVLIFAVIAFIVTWIFEADVDAQGGAYATGVLVLMTSAAFAVMLAVKKKGNPTKTALFGVIAVIFLYTTAINIFERPEGIKIASIFIGAIIAVSLISRIYRTTELRVEEFKFDAKAQEIIQDSARGDIRIIAHHPGARTPEEYQRKELQKRQNNHIPPGDPIVFLEVTVVDASDFAGAIVVRGEERHGFKILRVYATTVPNSIAALLLHIRDETGGMPHAYFSWSEGNPLLFLIKYLFLGQGDVPPVTHEVLREAEPIPERRPMIHVSG